MLFQISTGNFHFSEEKDAQTCDCIGDTEEVQTVVRYELLRLLSAEKFVYLALIMNFCL